MLVRQRPFHVRVLAALAVLGSAVGIATADEPVVPEPPPIAEVLPPPGPLMPRRPGVLERPLVPEPADLAGRAFILPAVQLDPPLGFTGPSSVVPRSGAGPEYETVEDRWRIGFPYWDRYGQGFPLGLDYPYRLGEIANPYTQNVLKGDYPIVGSNIFLDLTGTLGTLLEYRNLPTATTPFESTLREGQVDFFGRGGQFLYNQFVSVSADVFQGDAAFRPPDWRVKITPVFAFNNLAVQEVGVVSPDVLDGTRRPRTWLTLQEWFGEVKLADLSPEYDFVSVRAGSQPFVSDFRGFIFADVNAAVRVFGTTEGNRNQFNLAVFHQLEKETVTLLNSLEFRDQYVAVANLYRQDCFFPGYTAQVNAVYNNDGESFLYDRNRFLVRPDPAGVAAPHRVQALYLGWTGDGHIDRYNISHALYWVVGRDDLNPLANRPVEISAQMAALELSYDRDWIRFRASGFWASGDGDINNNKATGFDTVFDNPAFAGGEFSYWQRQNIPIFGVQLTQRNSFVPNLRSSKFQGQSNFVNPGLWLVNGGIDVEITPALRSINNANFLWFDKTAVLRQFLFQDGIDREIGLDLSTGIEYRPLLNNNVILLAGAAVFCPANGFRQIYNRFREERGPLGMAFVELALTY